MTCEEKVLIELLKRSLPRSERSGLVNFHIVTYINQ